MSKVLAWTQTIRTLTHVSVLILVSHNLNQKHPWKCQSIINSPILSRVSTIMEAQALHSPRTHQGFQFPGTTFRASLLLWQASAFPRVPAQVTLSKKEQPHTPAGNFAHPRCSKLAPAWLLLPNNAKKWTRVPSPPAVSKVRKEVAPPSHRDASSYLEVHSRRKTYAR